ncbi:MAG: type II toxin-antitoxin system VapC family toxin [Ktedonobacteraceae bacterium]
MDTSAIIKRYVPAETGSNWTIALCEPNAGQRIVLAQATLVEAIATICRKAREPQPTLRITKEERERLIALFRLDIRKQYHVIPVTVSLYTKAGNLCRIHPLRAYDAIQLACALSIRNKLISSDQPAPVFVSADDKLLDIARAEGFAVENPNNYN